uniref:1-acyl-sn-glycerol-3-phosphate acyltransferase n=1 Tax=candidate division WOR-3 bacterium TaxID=2052148 RepID=A0A7V3KNI2_UNCW3
MSFKWILAKIILYIPFKFIFRLRVYGSHNVPRKGPCIICVNHTSFWDPPFVGFASPRELHFLAKRELFENVKAFGMLISFYNAIPIDRENSLSGLKRAMNLLKEGKALVIFPEGTRNRTKNKFLLPLKEGAALLSLKMNVPIIPAYLFESKGNVLDWITGKRKLRIRFGKPLLPGVYKMDSDDPVKDLTKDIEWRMRELYARG